MLKELPVLTLHRYCTSTIGTVQHGSITGTVENGKGAPIAPVLVILTTNQPAPCRSIARVPVPTVLVLSIIRAAPNENSVYPILP